MDSRIDEVLAFWFGSAAVGATDDPAPALAASRRWFARDAAFDAQIREHHGALHAEAVRGGGATAAWRDTARGALATLVVLDQFSRNLYRDDPRAFAADADALQLALALVDTGRDRELGYLPRMVALLPLEHAEDRAMQRRSVAEYTRLLADARTAHAPAAVLELLAVGLDYAERHAVIVERFGRFPHRNRALGRTSTPEELAFLETPGSSF